MMPNHHLRRRRAWTLLAGLSLVLLWPGSPLHAQDMSGLLRDLAQGLGAPEGNSGPLAGRLIQMVALMTALSLAPGLLVVMTSFTRFIIVFSMLRSALGLNQSPPNVVLIALAFFMTLFVMQPVFEDAWNEGLAPMLADELDEETAFPRMIEPFHRFMAANTRDKDIALFLSLTEREAPEGLAIDPESTAAVSPETPWSVLVPAFMISELKRAFTIGFLIYLPFVAIDLIVASILMGAGMMMLPPVMISLPFKVIFFVLIDGWYMLAGSLIKSYAGY